MTTEELLNDKFEVEILRKNLISYRNAIRYAGYLIFHNDTVFFKEDRFKYVHEDYDGAPDAHDYRFGTAATIEDCIQKINEALLEQL